MPSKVFTARPAPLAAAAIILALAAGLAGQAAPDLSRPPAKPDRDQKCPVCGMFVAEYPDFLAAAVFKDGAIVYFDGCKDMFRFLLDTGAYAPGRGRGEIARVWVTDYYSLAWTDAARAFFVKGSDVLGPMGRELIPFGKEEEAREFLKDHKGQALYRFDQVTAEVVKDID
jgi:nitrous oxide reductase accessory protein NosL